jgi:hypothetical protein
LRQAPAPNLKAGHLAAVCAELGQSENSSGKPMLVKGRPSPTFRFFS